MKPHGNRFNPKRRLLPIEEARLLKHELSELGRRVRYGGNPEHKRKPGDFDLTPPSAPRPGKSLCDDAGVFKRAEALSLLRKGFEQGLVSKRFDGEWPFNVWSVSDDGTPFEAQWEADGVYHGYPMPDADPLRDEVKKRSEQPFG